ncbi:hypothetical protein C8J57DRAFT_1727340 [Mycena rebaudengoi]|nr:hypothetical protein C8J57DRAFT_1727340 [Mycena rebaudengoi]
MATLKFDSDYWETSLPDIQKLPAEEKLHLILSLVIFLGVSIRALLAFIFESNILAVKDRASRFLGYTPSHDDPHLRFPPSHIFAIWTERCTSTDQRDQLREMITPLAHAIDLTIARMRELMQPGVLARKYQDLSPFLYGLLHTFTASPNRYRREKKDKQEKRKAEESESSSDSMPVPEAAAAESGADSDWDDDPDVDYDESALPSRSHDRRALKALAITLAISMLSFVRNRATNLLPLLLGLFFKISGTSTRVLRTLSNTGVCVSGRTVERLKARISDDAIQLGIALIRSGTMFCTLFGNINIFLRKSQQRITNRNSMIHATNVALIAIPGVDPAAQDLEARLVMRGLRAAATVDDI